MSETNYTTSELAAMLAERKAIEKAREKARLHQLKVEKGEIGPRGRRAGSISLRAQILNDPASVAAFHALYSADPKNVFLARVFRDLYRAGAPAVPTSALPEDEPIDTAYSTFVEPIG